jgi:hypothetical protein
MCLAVLRHRAARQAGAVYASTTASHLNKQLVTASPAVWSISAAQMTTALTRDLYTCHLIMLCVSSTGCVSQALRAHYSLLVLTQSQSTCRTLTVCFYMYCMLLYFPLQPQEDKLKFSFMVFDEDGNGVITKAELTRILKANHMASSEAEVARKADTIMNQADKGVYAYTSPQHCM